MTTHYDVLGVSPKASPDQIKRAYYRRARAYHPDGHVGSSVALLGEAQRAMADLNGAWRVLRDPATRRAYDHAIAGATPLRVRGDGRGHPREDTAARLEIGAGFRYWMAAVGPVRRAHDRRPRLNLAVDGAADLAPLRDLAPDRLFALHAGRSRVDDAQLRHLHGLASLQLLDLAATPVTDAGLVHLLGLDRLEDLSLWDTAVSDEGLSVLGRLPSLCQLGLGNTRVTDDGLRFLAGLRNLRVLQLWGTPVSGPGLRHLSDLERLEIISLPRRVSGRHRRQLKAALPGALVI